MKKLFVMFCLIIVYQIHSLTNQEIRFCIDHDLFNILSANEQELNDKMLYNPQDSINYEALIKLYKNRDDKENYANILFNKAMNLSDLSSAVKLTEEYKIDSSLLSEYVKNYIDELTKEVFTDSISIMTLNLMIDPDESLRDTLLKKTTNYNLILETWSKELSEAIAIERNNSERILKANSFLNKCPNSKYVYSVFRYKIKSLFEEKRYDEAYAEIKQQLEKVNDALYSYILADLLLSPQLRKNIEKGLLNDIILNQVQKLLSDALTMKMEDEINIDYRIWSQEYFLNRIYLTQIKKYYYQILGERNLFGDENVDITIFSKDELKLYYDGLSYFDKIRYRNNDFGDLAEKHYWQGRYYYLLKNKKITAAKSFIQCLKLGSPRNKFQDSAYKYLQDVHSQVKSKAELMSWVRDMEGYDGPIFEHIEGSIDKIKGSRISIGDINNDKLDDICVDGKYVLFNHGEMKFSNISDSVGIFDSFNRGSLWIDIDKNGKQDLIISSASSSNPGDRIFLNLGWNKFISSEDKVGKINDYSPTEGMACFDINYDGLPEIYMANYHDSEYVNYSDRYYAQNQRVYEDETTKLNSGFSAQAGRGVAPGDFDNDGIQELFVTNYRLDRNFLFDYKNKKFINVAGLNTLDGEDSEGYFGHSIGATWADYDMDGDLDLFVANLAHPRYLDISQISTLYRNDGKQKVQIDKKEIEYFQFTDVTKEAGIKYDELHAEPNFIDVDNDGDLDLFITSIYKNERSYLYENLGNGTFKDVTWLANARTLNSWTSASSDFDHDGMIDIIVGSNDGITLLKNESDKKNKAIYLKPYWNENGFVDYEFREKWDEDLPNSPAFGSRSILTVRDKNGESHQLIRELSCGKGTTSQDSQWIHFGIGESKAIKLEIEMGGKKVKEYYFN